MFVGFLRTRRREDFFSFSFLGSLVKTFADALAKREQGGVPQIFSPLHFVKISGDTPPVIRVIEKFPPLLGRKRLVGKDVQHALKTYNQNGELK
jgi:hypothetical protein